MDSLTRPAGPDAGFASIYLHTHERIAEGDVVEVGLRLDAEPRVVAEPPDLADVLDRAPQARAAFDRLPYGLKRKHVRAIEDAQSPRRGSGASPS